MSDNRERPKGTQLIQPPRKGQPIQESFLVRISDAVNDATKRLNAPFDPDAGVPEDLEGDEFTADETWEELDRTTTTVRVEDPDDSETFVDVKQIDTVRLQRPDGTIVEFVFNNPTEE